jgi:phosphatidyl-myo-inositol alpha-mannosyltransferase
MFEAPPHCSRLGPGTQTSYREGVRVALVCPYSLSLPGGVQGQVLGLARSLRAMGHVTRVLAPCDGPPPDGGVTPLGRSVPLATNGSVAPIAPDPACALRTIRALRDEDFDVIHLHEPLVPGPTVTALFLRNRPLVGTFHRAGGSAAYTALRPLVRWGAGRLDLRCAVSVDARDTAAEALGGDYELVFNGIEAERFVKASPWPTEGPTILFMGRHEPRKGLDVLLRAMDDLEDDVRLWVASDGPQTAELKASVAGDPRIEWLGRLSDEEAAARLRGADVFCAPSVHGESFGVVLLEAMSACTPIVASALPGYQNVARDGLDAVLVPPADPGALAAALRQVLDDSTLAHRLVTAGEGRAAEFSMDKLAERYLDLYRRVA